MVRIPSSGTCTVHKSGIWSCSSNPTVGVSFDISFWRDSDSFSTLRWSISNTSMTSSNANFFNYNFYVYVGVDSPDKPYNDDEIWSLIRYDAQTKTPWYNYISKKYPTGYCTNTSTTGKATVKIYVKGGADGCCNANNGYAPCYPGNYWHLITSYEVDVPPYESIYTITYNTNGGSPSIPSQNKSSLVSSITLSNITPTKTLKITYYNNPTYEDTVNYVFKNGKWDAKDPWDTSLGEYAPGASYSTNSNATMNARWDPASFIPVAMPENYITVTYNSNGGIVSPQNTQVARTKLGYSENQSATTATYIVGTQYTTDHALNLYPIYGTATLLASNMPTPTKAGYRFIGWFRDSTLSDQITDYNPLVTSTNTTVYAKWEAMPIHILDNTDWADIGPYVWKCIGGHWYKIAHTYELESGTSGNKWVDLISAPQPADVFNHGNIVGLNPYYADGIVKYNQNNNYYWSYNNTAISKPYSYNAMMTLGGLCDRGNFRYLCFECEGSGTSGEYNYFYVGIRFMRKGKGSSWGDIPNVFYKVTDYREHKPASSRQVLKLDLYQFSAEPFYISVISCDCTPYIYSMWFE